MFVLVFRGETREMVPLAMTIAGFDSCGGAGVTADIKTFNMLNVYGVCVITALTAQNTQSVRKVLPVDPKFVEEQLTTVLEDMKIHAVKTGILPCEDIVDVVARFVEDYELTLVIDPVFRSKTGKKFVSERTIQSYIEKLLPLATIVTPNIYEASLLAKVKIRNVDDMEKAAEKILKTGVKNLIIKGGHLKGKTVTDLFFHKNKSVFYVKPRLKENLHGGGCFFSAALTACLARGMDVPQAVEEVESIVQEVFGFGLKVGKGFAIVNPLVPLYNKAEKYTVYEEVNHALDRILKEKRVHQFFAEVGTQIAEALPYPSKIQHVAAVDGRIRKKGDEIKVGRVKFGVSSHMARLILACNKLNPAIRAAINLRYDRRLLDVLRKEGLAISSFDRRLEPKKWKKVEGKTLDWGVSQAVKKVGKVPDVIYDLGEKGKEPMVRIVGKNVLEIVEKVCRALANLDTE